MENECLLNEAEASSHPVYVLIMQTIRVCEWYACK